MWGVQLRENLDFLLYILNLIFCTLEIDDLDCYGLLSSLVVTGGIANKTTKQFSGLRLTLCKLLQRNPFLCKFFRA